jgi:hypothetical protein
MVNTGYVPRRRGLKIYSGGQNANRIQPNTQGFVASLPSWHKQYNPKDASSANVLQTAVNTLLRYMDPGTQWQMGQWLAQQNPTAFGSYANVQKPPGVPGSQRISQPQAGYSSASASPQELNPNQYLLQGNRLWYAMDQLTPRKLAEMVYGTGAPTAVQTEAVNKQMAPLTWLREYLNTANQAMPTLDEDLGFQRKTRAAKAASAAHLETLENQVLNNNSLAPVLALAQNLVNPQLRSTSPSEIGTVGYRRAITKPFGSSTTRGGVGRNLWLT